MISFSYWVKTNNRVTWKLFYSEEIDIIDPNTLIVHIFQSFYCEKKMSHMIVIKNLQ